MAEDNQSEQQLNIELPEDVAEGHFVNLAMIGHSPSEFVVDFIRTIPGVPKAKVKSRIILTPEHAKRLLAALQDNISRYESSFGGIRTNNESPNYLMNFGGTVGEA